MSFIKRIIQILVSLGLLSYLIYLTDLNTLKNNFRQINIFYCLLCFIFIYLGLFLSSTRWMLIFRRFGYRINSFESFIIYWLGSFYNNFLPTSVGGDGFRAIFLIRRKKSPSKSVLGSILLERGTGLLSIGCINIALAPMFFQNISSSSSFFFLESVVFCFSVLLLLVFLFHRIIYRVAEKLFRSWTIWRKFVEFLDFLTTSLSLVDILVTLALSLLFYAEITIANFFLFKAIGVGSVSLLFILFAISINSVLGVLPISFNSIGITEALFVFLYTSYGISSDLAILMVILGRFLPLIATSFAGLIPLFSMKYSI